MDLTDAITQIKTQLVELRNERDRLRSKLEEVSEEGNRLAAILNGLQEAAIRLEPDKQHGVPTQLTSGENWSGVGRTAAVLRVVAEADHPVGPSEIVEILRTKGRADDTIHLASAALAYLARQSKVGSIGRGQWVPYDRLPGTSAPRTPAALRYDPMEEVTDGDDDLTSSELETIAERRVREAFPGGSVPDQ